MVMNVFVSVVSYFYDGVRARNTAGFYDINRCANGMPALLVIVMLRAPHPATISVLTELRPLPVLGNSRSAKWAKHRRFL
jgi:hypothetical protein